MRVLLVIVLLLVSLPVISDDALPDAKPDPVVFIDAAPDQLPDAVATPETAKAPALPIPVEMQKWRNPAGNAAYVFGAKWCVWCNVMKPAVQQLIAEGYDIQEIDVDQDQNAAADWEAFVLPTIIVHAPAKDGRLEVAKIQKGLTYAELKAFLDSNKVLVSKPEPPKQEPPLIIPQQPLVSGCSTCGSGARGRRGR